MNTHKHYETARRAHAWTSFSPEKRATSECAYFDEIMKEFEGKPDVQAKFERLFLLSLSAKSRCANSMITGPARFPVEKQRRASDREHKISGEMVTYIDRVRAAIKREELRLTNPELFPILNTDENALEMLKHKLTTLEGKHKNMVEVNKMIRKGDNAGVYALMGTAAGAILLDKRGWWGNGYAPFELTNNNAKIKATRDRIAQLERRETMETKTHEIGGVRVVENIEADRLQLHFDGKPAANIITTLKKHGFRWSPSNMAWQRQLTGNARYSFKTFIKPLLDQVAA